MISFQSRVDNKCQNVPGKIIKVECFQDRNGKKFAIVINRVLWYAVRIIYQIHESGGDNDVIIEKKSEHRTQTGALNKIDDFKRELC